MVMEPTQPLIFFRLEEVAEKAPKSGKSCALFLIFSMPFKAWSYLLPQSQNLVKKKRIKKSKFLMY
jgi:hypothetical protein